MIAIQIMSPVSFLKATMMETQKKRKIQFCPKSTINHNKTPNINNRRVLLKKNQK